jgi:hypothetical protein
MELVKIGIGALIGYFAMKFLVKPGFGGDDSCISCPHHDAYSYQVRYDKKSGHFIY